MDSEGFVDVGTHWEIKTDLPNAISVRDSYLAHNPNMIFLVGLPWLFVDLDTYPSDSPYWLRDAHGQIAMGYGLARANTSTFFMRPKAWVLGITRTASPSARISTDVTPSIQPLNCLT